MVTLEPRVRTVHLECRKNSGAPPSSEGAEKDDDCSGGRFVRTAPLPPHGKKHLRSLDFRCFSFTGNLPDSPLAGNDILKQPRGTVRLPGAVAMHGFFGRAFYFSCVFRSEGARGAFWKPQFYLPGTGIYS